MRIIVFVKKGHTWLTMGQSSYCLCISMIKSCICFHTTRYKNPCHQISDGKKLTGLVDVVALEKCVWGGEQGEEVRRSTLTADDERAWEAGVAGREMLTDTLTDMDSCLADKVITLNSLRDVTAQDLRAAVRRATIAQVTHRGFENYNKLDIYSVSFNIIFD